MTIDLSSIEQRWREAGALTPDLLGGLAEHLRGPDPYEAITLAGDCAARQLANDVAVSLGAEDAMVRWNAAALLFTRWREASLAPVCLDMAESDPDELVRAVALCGVGELLPHVSDTPLLRRMASLLLSVLGDTEQLLEYRGAAYEGMLAALGVPPADRPPASRLFDPTRDLRRDRVADFAHRYADGDGG